jgi:hypothetical protein
MCRPIPPLPNTPSWHAAQLKRRDNFTFYARMGEGRGVYRDLVGRPEGEEPLGRPRRRWEDNISWTLGRWESMGQTEFS